MSGVDVVVETSAPPDSVREALLDFTPRRPERWPGITPDLYEVYEVRERSAETRRGRVLQLARSGRASGTSGTTATRSAGRR